MDGGLNPRRVGSGWMVIRCRTHIGERALSLRENPESKYVPSGPSKSTRSRAKVTKHSRRWRVSLANPTPLSDSYYLFHWLIFKKETTTITTEMGIHNMYPWIFWFFNGGLMFECPYLFLDGLTSWQWPFLQVETHFPDECQIVMGWKSIGGTGSIYHLVIFPLSLSLSLTGKIHQLVVVVVGCFLSDISKKRASSFISRLTAVVDKPKNLFRSAPTN